MAQNKSTKRKALKAPKESILRQAEIQPLRVEDMVIACPGSLCHFKRLRYKGCPTLSVFGSEFSDEIELINMNRDGFIRGCYQILVVSSLGTLRSRFGGLIEYLRWLDAEGRVVDDEGYFSSVLIDGFMTWCFKQVDLGLMKLSGVSYRKSAISWFLREYGKNLEASNLPIVEGRSDETKAHQGLDLETELKPITRELFRAFRVMAKHFNDGTMPDRHPLYNENLIRKVAIERSMSKRALGDLKASFKNCLAQVHPNNHIVRLAMMITYLFTGMNTSPLARLRIADISFREVQGGKYILDSVKGRAVYQEQDNALGFSKHAKSFMESWVDIAMRMANNDKQAYMFPYFTSDNRIISYEETGQAPQFSINKMLQRLGLPKITASILRKTKSDTIYRVTDSVYLVAMSNNNSISVTARTYIHGTEKEHENNLSAAMSAKHAIAKGGDISGAVDAAKHQFADILDDYEYQNLRKGKDRSHESKTPSGVRCNDNRKGAAQVIDKVLKRAGIDTEDNEVVCTDFLGCFDCQDHALVSDVDDIWLMLSFMETLQQLQQTPAINSMPEGKYTKLFNTVTAVLEGHRDKNLVNFKSASNKLKEAPHPLYANVYSLNDLLEVFA